MITEWNNQTPLENVALNGSPDTSKAQREVKGKSSYKCLEHRLELLSKGDIN